MIDQNDFFDENSEEEGCTPPDIIEIARATKNSLLPDKSKDRYEKTYDEFMVWRKKKNTNSFSQRVMIAYRRTAILGTDAILRTRHTFCVS